MRKRRRIATIHSLKKMIYANVNQLLILLDVNVWFNLILSTVSELYSRQELYLFTGLTACENCTLDLNICYYFVRPKCSLFILIYSVE